MASVESEVIRYDGCFVCGLQNPIGLNLKFVSDGETVRTEFSPKPEHEGYKGILHGGILAAIIDEVMIKVPLARNIVCLTASMEVRFKSPATIRDTLYFEGKIEEHKGGSSAQRELVGRQRGES